MARSLLTFAGRLQPVAQLTQHPADGGRTHSPPLLCQRSGQPRPTLACPAKRRGWVSARQRVHQRFECGQQTGLALFETGPPGARTSYPVCRRFALRDLPPSLPDRLPGQTRGRRHQRVPAIADGQRLGGRPPAATALIQHGRDRRVLRDDGGFQFHVALHATEIDHTKPRRWQVDFRQSPKETETRPSPRVSQHRLRLSTVRNLSAMASRWNACSAAQCTAVRQPGRQPRPGSMASRSPGQLGPIGYGRHRGGPFGAASRLRCALDSFVGDVDGTSFSAAVLRRPTVLKNRRTVFTLWPRRHPSLSISQVLVASPAFLIALTTCASDEGPTLFAATTIPFVGWREVDMDRHRV